MHAFASRCVFLLFITAIGLTPAVAQAQEPASEGQQEPVLDIKEIVVSTSRLPSVEESIYAVPSKVTVITAEDIQQSGAKTVQEAIANATGIVMYNQVGNNFEQSIDLRGFNGLPGPSTTVFVDGVRVNQPGLNQINFDLIPVESIERIEILPGPSAIYGGNALAGVINIITKSGSAQRQATGEIAFGSFGRERYNINTGGLVGRLDYYANFTREVEDGFRNDSDARISRFFGKVGYRPTDQTDLAVAYTYVKDRLSQAGSLPLSDAAINPRTNITPGDFFDREDNFVRFNGRAALPFGFSVNANGFYRRLQEESFLVSQPFFPGGPLPTSTNISDVESLGGVLQLTHEGAPFGLRNSLVVGGELSWSDYATDLLAGSFISRNATDEEIAGAYIQDTLYLIPQLVLTGGLRYDRDELDFKDAVTPSNNKTKVFERLTPRAGLTYRFTPEASAYFSYSQGFRVPNNNELFALGLFGSNPNLQAVRSSNFEFGLKSKVGTWAHLIVAVYQANIRDEILFTCILCNFSEGDGENRNIAKSRRRGIEGTLTVKPNKYLDGAVNYTYTEAQFRSSFILGAGGSNAQTIKVGDSFALVPKNRLSVTLTAHPTQEWSLSLNGLYVSTQFLQNDESNSKERLPGYFVLSGRIAYERPVPGGRLSAFFMINNILDTEYFTSGIFANNNITGVGASEAFVVPAPAIALYGGLSYRFEAFPG